MTSRSQKLKDLADKIITSSTPSRLGRSSTMAVYVSLIEASFCATENDGVRYSRACAQFVDPVHANALLKQFNQLDCKMPCEGSNAFLDTKDAGHKAA